MATVVKKVDVLDKTFKTSDGRMLFVYIDSFIPGRLEIRLGNIGRFEFYDESKCRRKLNWFIKELDAKEVFETSEGWQ